MKKNEIREYLLNNEDVLLDVVSELNSWNGCLDNLDFWENDEEFFNTFFDNPMEAIRATYYGNYNYNDDYVKFNGYGNIDSYSEYERIEEIKDKTEMTEESEYVKREFIDIKKKMNDIEKFITQVNANLSMRSNLKKDKKEEGTKIVIEIDVSMFSVMITVIVLCVIISVIVTGKKLIYNIKFGAVHVKE